MNFQVEAIRSSFDIRDYVIKEKQDLPNTYKCPIEVPVKSQGSKPTCVAHGTSSLAEYHYKRQNNNSYKVFSTEFIYGLRDIGYFIGDGMMIRDALKTLKKYGIPFYEDCPGNNDIKEAVLNINNNLDRLVELAYPHRISAYYKCNSQEGIKTALITNGPVLVCMRTYRGATLENDIYTWDPKANYGLHCVFIYGWDERGWLVQNSWGSSYGGDGRFVIPFSYKFKEAWGVSDNITSCDVIIKKRNAFLDLIYKGYNKIVNFWLNLIDKD